MFKEHKRNTLYLGKFMLNIRKIKRELYEHRYYFEKNVVNRTEHLMKRIKLMEACNASLSYKLALSQKELAALKDGKTKPIPAQKSLRAVNTHEYTLHI